MGIDTKLIFATLSAAFIIALVPDAAHAFFVPAVPFFGGGGAGGIAGSLCTIAGWFQGGVGRAIASLAVIFLGISAFFGKATWGMALMFAAGIFAIFGSGSIISAVVPWGGGC